MPRGSRPVLGVIGHNYLRERGLLQMMTEVRVCYFGLADSALHRIADYSVPIPSLDISEAALERSVRSIESKGVRLAGFVSLRDFNVSMVAEIAKRRSLPGPDPVTLRPVQSKSKFRQFINEKLPDTSHGIVHAAPLPKESSKRAFDRIVSGLLKHGSVIIKPDRGSCSYHIIPVDPDGDLYDTWLRFKRGSSFRGGDFIAEQRIRGRELAVETIVDDRIRDMRITQYLRPDSERFHETGHFVPDEFLPSERDKVFRLVSEVHSALGLKHMVTHMELILPRRGLPSIVELNPRLAGDLTQELHAMTSGIEYYRVAARLATGQPVSRRLLGGIGKHTHALIKFKSPGEGVFSVSRWPIGELRNCDDRVGVIPPGPDALGDTNDDRPGYALLVGNDRRELERRATRLLRRIARQRPATD